MTPRGIRIAEKTESEWLTEFIHLFKKALQVTYRLYQKGRKIKKNIDKKGLKIICQACKVHRLTGVLPMPLACLACLLEQEKRQVVYRHVNTATILVERVWRCKSVFAFPASMDFPPLFPLSPCLSVQYRVYFDRDYGFYRDRDRDQVSHRPALCSISRRMWNDTKMGISKKATYFGWLNYFHNIGV